ncbi:MAG: hypothetical protein AAB074_06030 [Planctomycetota bacterium]
MRFALAAALLALPLAARAQAPETLDEKACMEVVKKIEAAVAAADGEAFDEVLGLRVILEKIVKDLETEDKNKKDFIEGVMSASLGTQITDQLTAGGTIKFLRLHVVDGRTRALFRMLNPNGGVNYHDWILVKDGDGARTEDLYIYLMGESLARTFKREFLKGIAVMSKAPGNLKGWEKDFLDAQPKVAEMQAAVKDGDSKKALKIYNDLPQTVREDKLTMIQRVSIALEVGDAEYTAALADWEKLFPGDPSMDLMQIDAFAMKGEFEKSADVVARLAKTIGGDPFLDGMRAGLFLQAGKLDEATASAEKAAKEEKGLALPHFVLLQVSLKKKDHAATVRELTVLEKECGVPILDFEAEEGFESFVESEEYKKWKEGRK